MCVGGERNEQVRGATERPPWQHTTIPLEDQRHQSKRAQPTLPFSSNQWRVVLMPIHAGLPALSGLTSHKSPACLLTFFRKRRSPQGKGGGGHGRGDPRKKRKARAALAGPVPSKVLWFGEIEERQGHERAGGNDGCFMCVAVAAGGISRHNTKGPAFCLPPPTATRITCTARTQGLVQSVYASGGRWPRRASSSKEE